jgi:C4-dicarboxylate-specific signal transduction histidine kinase
MIEYAKRRWAHVKTARTDEQKRKLNQAQVDWHRARIKAMSPSELKEYRAKQSLSNLEARLKMAQRLSPEERKAFHRNHSRKYRAKHKALKFLSKMAKIGTAIKAIAHTIGSPK